ncbi:site-specific integrase [Jeotgalibacillus terrae]|uniref:Tyrosine-type recombinase/integrase n=1 Tax=Jeotgalibacillus terrae TaxID=587735 RepID=A0ABW5ZIM0_9BACL|nr:tyrosine-type recombinase/integrase [Jeotgalibacillus terrae]MBM7580066.1 integrase [Jeotgalibacillus terrae]
MASITKRGKTWQYTVSRYTDGKYDPIRKGGFKGEKEARLAAAKVELDLAEGVQESYSSDIFADYFEEWVEDFKSNRATPTKKRYKTTHNIIKEEFGRIKIKDINKRRYQRFLNNFGKKHSHETLRKINTHIRACVKEAVDEGIIRTDFTRGVEINGQVKAKSANDKFLSFSDAQMLLEYLHIHRSRSPLYYLLILGLQTGMRYGELLGLKKSDFKFDENIIEVRRTLDYKYGEGIGPLKSEERDLEMDEWTMKLFQDELFKSSVTTLDGMVFFNPRTKYGTYSNAAPNKILKKALKKLEIKPEITVHGLRHTHISILLFNDINVQYVSERAGHKDTTVTLQTYAHVLKEMENKEKTKTRDVLNQMTKIAQ